MQRTSWVIAWIMLTGGIAHAQGPRAAGPDPAAVLTKLRQRLSGAGGGPMELGKAIQALRDATGLNIHVNWAALSEAGVTAETQTDVALAGVSGRAALETICRASGAASPLAWNIDSKIIVISTREDLMRKTVAVSYPAERHIREAPGESRSEKINALLEALRGAVSPDASGVGGGPGGIRELRGNFLVNASPLVHRQVRRFFTLCQKGMPPEEWNRLLSSRRKLGGTRVSVNWAGKAPRDCISEISRLAGVAIVMDAAELAAAGVGSDSRVRLKLSNTTAWKALETLLADIGGTHTLAVDVIAEGELLCVTTRERLSTHLAAFDVTPPAARRLRATDIQAASDVIAGQVAPGSWRRRGGKQGVLAVVSPRRIICVQTLDNLVSIAKLVGQAKLVAMPRAPSKPARPPSATSRPASRRTGEVESAGAAEKAYRVAKMYETNGLTEKAVELYKGVIRDYPGSSAAKRAQDDVRRLSRP